MSAIAKHILLARNATHNQWKNIMSPNYQRPDAECEEFNKQNLPHYHIVKLNDNISTRGRVDRNHEFKYLGLGKSDFREISVLDVGALDGVISFNAEKSGASKVLAIDVEDPAQQDWGWSGATEKYSNLGNVKNRVFPALKQFFSSNVRREQKTVYQIKPEDGPFDIIFFYGVLYHLRHPLLAFDKLRAACSGAICIETHVCNYDPMVPSALFYLDDVLYKADSNWTGPSESCVVSWMKDAGFNNVYIETKPRMQSRQRFIGFIDKPTFTVNSGNFSIADGTYYSKVRANTLHKIETGRLWRY
ncbi:MAG: DUF1698 domain-containing protein [Gammaproteobacteria bacterium]